MIFFKIHSGVNHLNLHRVRGYHTVPRSTLKIGQNKSTMVNSTIFIRDILVSLFFSLPYPFSFPSWIFPVSF